MTRTMNGWKSWASLLGLAVALAAAAPSPVRAHGERSIMAVLRMRTIQFYDVEWSKTQVGVNEELRLTGKFHVMDKAWPSNSGKPDVAFFNIAVAGPRFVRTEQRINGEPVFNSGNFELGRDYSFETVLRARHPGRWHVHPMLNGEGAGPMPGPGQWIQVTGNAADFTDPVKTLTGEVIDLERWGRSAIVNWHLFWALAGLVWVVWWLRRPTFIPRYRMLKFGDEEGLIRPSDRLAGLATLVGTLLVVGLAYAATVARYPNADVPLNGDRHALEPLPPQVSSAIQVKPVAAQFSVPHRSVKMKLRVTNTLPEPIRVAEFSTAGVRFVSPDSGIDPTAGNYPQELVAKTGLRVGPKNVVAPGDTAELELDATDAVWQTELLIDLTSGAGTSVAGLLFFHDASGKRHMVPVFSPIVPSFA